MLHSGDPRHLGELATAQIYMSKSGNLFISKFGVVPVPPANSTILRRAGVRSTCKSQFVVLLRFEFLIPRYASLSGFVQLSNFNSLCFWNLSFLYPDTLLYRGSFNYQISIRFAFEIWVSHKKKPHLNPSWTDKSAV